MSYRTMRVGGLFPFVLRDQLDQFDRADAFSIHCASRIGVVASNIACNGISISKAFLTREARRVANKEWPPRSRKKWASALTLSSPSTCLYISTMAVSAAVRGSTNRQVSSLREEPGAGSAVRFNLPLLVLGSSCKTVSVAGIMYAGSSEPK